MENEDFEQLNADLLEADGPPVETATEPKRNSKHALIQKILEMSEQEGIPLEVSNTKLKRMNKGQLVSLCADMVEKGVRKKMARSVGADSGDDRAIALGALRMIHDVAAMGIEKAGDSFLGEYDYTIEGFSQNLKEPTVSRAIDGCLEEIANENAELLEYIQSPYSRLMIAWGGAIAFSCRKRQRIHAPHMQPRKARVQVPVRRSSGGRPPHGKKHADHAPPKPNVKAV